ncbi:MAG TPA: hypothetical protein VFR30_10365, partial [Lysobacter sp.]|nr:hypothetical protein [Lysobacter sp.]
IELVFAKVSLVRGDFIAVAGFKPTLVSRGAGFGANARCGCEAEQGASETPHARSRYWPE